MRMWHRRDFLKASGLAALGLNLWTPRVLERRLLAGPLDNDTKLVFIFQRGGNDAVNTVIPYGDPEYNVVNRPTLYIPENTALDLGNGFAGLHPRMAPLMELFNQQTLNGQDGPGNLAVIHRVGYPNPSQSHFNSQQYWENGKPGDKALDEGMLYRHIAAALQPQVNRLAGVGLSRSQLVALKGPHPLPTINNPNKFTLAGDDATVQKFIGQLPTTPGGDNGTGLLGAYGGPQDQPGHEYRDLVYGTGLALADAMALVKEAVAQGPHTPANGAEYPSGSFGEHLQQAAMLMKRTPARVLGLNIGGWDTHTNQGASAGKQGNLLEQVAQGFQALYRDLQDQWEKLVIVTMTEFGRTSRENGSGGTDHAHACCMFVAGGRVQGGVYNCDDSTWAPGDMFSTKDRYIRRNTDYRAIFAEIFTEHFGDDPALLETIIPGYAQAAQANPTEFRSLGIL
ncbi:MAG: DUF1501 domain-containing protein [Planctomycetes bacterium]|nr:DUF1501 domain-containing protein [Planctomycetota bacterium]